MLGKIALLTSLVCCDIGASAMTAGIADAAPFGQYVKTVSGEIRCWVSTTGQSGSGDPTVICEHGPGFPQAPVNSNGNHDDCAQVQASGAFEWSTGDIGMSGNQQTLSYGETFHIQGWTILPSQDGTRFTNDKTGRGMFISVENVSPF